MARDAKAGDVVRRRDARVVGGGDEESRQRGNKKPEARGAARDLRVARNAARRARPPWRSASFSLPLRLAPSRRRLVCLTATAQVRLNHAPRSAVSPPGWQPSLRGAQRRTATTAFTHKRGRASQQKREISGISLRIARPHHPTPLPKQVPRALSPFLRLPAPPLSRLSASLMPFARAEPSRLPCTS